MVTYADITPLPLTETDILRAIDRAQRSRLLDNLRTRHPNVQFDSKVRGFIGEIAFRNWAATQGIAFQAANYLEDATGMDVDLQYVAGEQCLNVELKTSLIPDQWRHLPTCLQRGDIKLIRRGRQTVAQLKGDIHVQIYYRQRRSAKDRWLARQGVDLENGSPQTIYDRLLGRAYLNNIFLVGWIDRPSLVARLGEQPLTQCLWQFPGSARKLWRCNIAQHARKPAEIISYLQDYPSFIHHPQSPLRTDSHP